jgi:hypothetical protein
VLSEAFVMPSSSGWPLVGFLPSATNRVHGIAYDQDGDAVSGPPKLVSALGWDPSVAGPDLPRSRPIRRERDPSAVGRERGS